MAATLGLRRAQRRRHISKDPTTIVVTRTERVASQRGGRTETVMVLAQQTVRLIQLRKGMQIGAGDMGNDVGEYTSVYRWAAQCEHTVDLKSGGQILDEFDAPDLGHFLVRQVNAEKIEGEVYGYLAELERIA